MIIVFPITSIVVETHANPISKVVTKASQKIAKKQIFFYIDKRTVELRNQFLKRKAIDELKEGVVKRQGYKTIQVSGRSPRMIHKDRAKHYQIKENLTSTDERLLKKAIDEGIEKKLTGGRKWTVIETIADWLIDYKFWITLPTTIPLLLSGDAAREVEDLAIEALYESGLLIPANNAPEPRSENNKTTYYNESNTKIECLDTQYLHESECFDIDPDKLKSSDDSFVVQEPEPLHFYKTFHTNGPIDLRNKKFMISGFNFDKEGRQRLEINFNYDVPNSHYDELIYSLNLSKYNDDGSFNLIYDFNNGITMFKNGKYITHHSWDFDTNLNLESLNTIYVSFLQSANNVHVTFNTDYDIIDLYLNYDFSYTEFEKNYPYFNGYVDFYTHGAIRGYDEHKPVDISNLEFKYVDLTKLETDYHKRFFNNDIDTEIPEIIHLPPPQDFPLQADYGMPLEIKENPEGEVIITGPNDTPFPEDGEIVVKDPVQPMPEPNPDTPPINETPVPSPNPKPNYPDPDYDPILPPGTPGGAGGDPLPSNPDIPDFSEGESCGKLDLDLKSADLFTNKFPFSIPWDILRAIDAIFGGMGSEKPQFEYEVYGVKIDIKIPDFIDNMVGFFRAFLIIVFDIGVIYALRKWFGGAT